MLFSHLCFAFRCLPSPAYKHAPPKLAKGLMQIVIIPSKCQFQRLILPVFQLIQGIPHVQVEDIGRSLQVCHQLYTLPSIVTASTFKFLCFPNAISCLSSFFSYFEIFIAVTEHVVCLLQRQGLFPTDCSFFASGSCPAGSLGMGPAENGTLGRTQQKARTLCEG